jgi:hypothetical protein
LLERLLCLRAEGERREQSREEEAERKIGSRAG